MTAAEEDERLLLARAGDAVRLSRKSVRFIGFLGPREQQLVKSRLEAIHFENALFWGGYKGAERVFAGFFPDRDEPDEAAFPLGAVRVSWREGALTHRDFLGSILSLGIERRAVGDIVPGDAASGDFSCAVVLDRTVLAFVSDNLLKVGGTAVDCAPADPGGIVRRETFRELRDTVASPRLDCVVAALLNLPREKAAELIRAGLVSLEYEACLKPTQQVPEGADLSARGYGRFIVDRIGPPTRKGRLGLTARKYM